MQKFLYTSTAYPNDPMDDFLLCDRKYLYLYVDEAKVMVSYLKNFKEEVIMNRFYAPTVSYSLFHSRLKDPSPYDWDRAGMLINYKNPLREYYEQVFVGGQTALDFFCKVSDFQKEGAVPKEKWDFCTDSYDWHICEDPAKFDFFTSLPTIEPDWANGMNWSTEQLLTPDATGTTLLEITVAEERWEIIDRWFERYMNAYRNGFRETLPRLIYTELIGGLRDNIAQQIRTLYPDLAYEPIPGVNDIFWSGEGLPF